MIELTKKKDIVTLSPINELQIFGSAQDFREFLMMYESAIKEVRTKLEILNDDFTATYNRNPIESIKSRVKSADSILEKMRRKNYEMTMESMMENLNDIAGVRVVCKFVDDIYTVAKMLATQDDIRIVKVKDYIKAPKENGYRSYHMIIEIPVFFANRKQYMKVEVQLRTIAMNFWASLEHQMRYKKVSENKNNIGSRLKYCAEVISRLDVEMQNISNSINDNDDL